MILITGATGHLGAAVIDSLLKRVPATEIAVCSKSPEKLARFAKAGIDVRRGDFGDWAGLAHSFRRVDRLLLVSASGIDHEKRTALHRNAVQAAIEAGVGHVYYTSLVHADDSIAYVMKAHRDTEELLRGSGLRYTVLRNGIYAGAWPTYLGDVSSGEVVIPADGPVAWVSRRDLADATALLLEEGGHHGETLTLTGPAALDINEFTVVLGRVLGKSLSRRIVPLEDYIGRSVAAGRTEEETCHWATTYFAMAKGEFSRVDPTLQTLLRRPSRQVGDALREKAI
jgi:NAD(P)H dehydrogenase (quinone)